MKSTGRCAIYCIMPEPLLFFLLSLFFLILCNFLLVSVAFPMHCLTSRWTCQIRAEYLCKNQWIDESNCDLWQCASIFSPKKNFWAIHDFDFDNNNSNEKYKNNHFILGCMSIDLLIQEITHWLMTFLCCWNVRFVWRLICICHYSHHQRHV